MKGVLVRGPKRGLSGVCFDEEVCRDIGVALLRKAYGLGAGGKLVRAGFFVRVIKNCLADEIKRYCSQGRAGNVRGRARELGYDDVPGMNNIVYSGGDGDE